MESKNSIAFSRDRRNNAGSRMMKLIEEEDEDDFYKTTYGGFTEEADDNDYVSEDSVSDAADSDFDVNEDDELKSDLDDEREVKKRSSKVYKDPKKATVSITQGPTEKSTKTSLTKVDKVPEECIKAAAEKKLLRKSTFEKSVKMEDVVKEREAKAAILKQIADKKRVAEVRRLTQEELLAEARITEEINLASLEYYQQMELERKRVRTQHQNNSGPTIRYTSITVSKNITPEEDDTDQKIDEKSCTKYSQNFVTFSGEQTFYENFPHQRPPQPSIKQVCSITHLPAKYFDPVTKQPYATVEAFKILRQEHKRQLELDNLDQENRKKNKNLFYF